MKGLDWLASVRERGLRPPIVLLTDWPYTAEMPNQLQIEDGDAPERIDLRALVSLTVTICLADPERLARWTEAVLAAKAKTVAVLLVEMDWAARTHVVKFEGVVRRDGVTA